MKAEQIILNIAVNLGRLSRWSSEGRTERIKQFLKETEEYLNQLESVEINDRFKPTLKKFKQELISLKSQPVTTYAWADRVLTWANILQHRAKLA